MNAIQHPRWFDGIFRFHRVQIHGLVTPLGRQLNGCLGTIVRFCDIEEERVTVNVFNVGLRSIKPENFGNYEKESRRALPLILLIKMTFQFE